MITIENINIYIEKIPPLPTILTQTLRLLNSGELLQASLVAKDDLALSSYLINQVNKPFYGFKNRVTDISQIFSILGLTGSKQTVYNYMINLLSPDSWSFFQLTQLLFHNLQAELSTNWKKITTHLKIKDKDIESSIALLPASIIVTEAIFHERREDIDIIRTNSDINLNTILKRLTKLDLFDICEKIAQKWDMPQRISQIIQSSSGIKPSLDEDINSIAKWMHLLLFYTLSKNSFVASGLNDFISFEIDYVMDIYDDFSTVMEIS